MSRTRLPVRDLLLDASVVFRDRIEKIELIDSADKADQPHPSGRSDMEAASYYGGDTSDRIIVLAHFSADTPIVQIGSELPRGILHRRFYMLTAARQRVEPRYLYWALRHQLERLKLAAYQFGSRQRLFSKDLLETMINLPERAEQIRFAHLLDSMDRLLALREEAEVARSGLLAAIYRQSFGVAPADLWGYARLGDLVEAERFPPGEGKPIKLDRGVILVWTRGVRCGQVEVLREHIRGPVHAILVMRRSSALDLHYLAEALRQSDLRRLTTGTVFPQLTAYSLLSLRIPLPPLALQRRFARHAKCINGLDELAAQGAQLIDWLGASLTSIVFDERPAGNDGYLMSSIGPQPRRKDTFLNGVSLDD